MRRAKLFPLPEVVLFPGAGLPLHVFELRYRQLMKDVLADAGVVAMPQIKAAQDFARSTPPDLLPILGVGVVAEYEEFSDGKFNLVVRGVARARLVRELPSDCAYREAELEVLTEDSSDVRSADISALVACLLELGRRRWPGETQQVLGQLAALQGDPGRLADLSAAALLPLTLHQRVLAELNVKRRLAFVTEQVAELLLATKLRPGGLPN